MKRHALWRRSGACVLLLLLLGTGLARAEKLVIAGDLWCPINCAADAEQRGEGVAVLDALMIPLHKKSEMDTETAHEH